MNTLIESTTFSKKVKATSNQPELRDQIIFSSGRKLSLVPSTEISFDYTCTHLGPPVVGSVSVPGAPSGRVSVVPGVSCQKGTGVFLPDRRDRYYHESHGCTAPTVVQEGVPTVLFLGVGPSESMSTPSTLRLYFHGSPTKEGSRASLFDKNRREGRRPSTTVGNHEQPHVFVVELKTEVEVSRKRDVRTDRGVGVKGKTFPVSV